MERMIKTSNNNLDDFEVQEIELRIKKAYDEWKKLTPKN